jgi:outer membrane protein assembly factor BamB
MKFSKNMTKTATVLLVILASTSLMLIANVSQPANAQLSATQPTVAIPSGAIADFTVQMEPYLSFRPTTIGVGQIFLVNMWLSPSPGAQRMFLDFTVTITKPDGTNDVIKMNSYPNDGTAWFEYSADQVGEWTLKFEFPGTYFPSGRYSNGFIVTNTTGTNYADSLYAAPGSTDLQKLTVQQEMVLSWPPAPLPTDYWTRPVAYEHREWWPILGDYPWYGPGVGSLWDTLYPDTNRYWGNYYFVPWVQGPESAHVVWKRPAVTVAGILGGDWETKSADQNIFSNTNRMGYPNIIYGGRAYQTLIKDVNGEATAVWQSFDIRTGEVYWEHITEIASASFFGATYYSPSYIEYATGQNPGGGGDPTGTITAVNLLFIGNGYLVKYNPFTGAITANVSISPLSSATYYMNGYALGVQNLGGGNYCLINWTTIGSSSNFNSRIISNITWPFSSLPSTADYNTGVAVSVSTLSDAGAYTSIRAMAANLKTGALMWNITRGGASTVGGTAHGETSYSGSCVTVDHGKVAILTEQGYYLALDQLSGQEVWKSSPEFAYPWDKPGFGAYAVASAYGLIYHMAYSGVYAIDWETGKIAWKYEAHPPFEFETPYIDENGESVYSWNTDCWVADGKVYVYNTEHSATVPITRGWKLHCINATSGEGVWSVMLPGAGSKHETDIGAIADGYLSMFGSDGYTYVFGKGKSAITVTAPDIIVAKGSGILIRGSVLDMSPAQPGTPCVSKESMATQMEYLHKQLSISGVYGNETLTGVPVVLTAIASDGTVIDLGTVTTNAYYGTFNMAWTPPDEGTYEIIVSFAGDESYGSSAAATAVSVGPATPTPSTPEVPTPVDNTMLLYGILVAVIIAIVLALVALFWKR